MEDTPLERLKPLVRELAALRPGFDELDAYYKGNPPLVKGPERLTKNYRELLEMGTSNWCRLVVDVCVERLIIESIKSSRAGKDGRDEAAWDMWQFNNLDAYQSEVSRAALRYGVAYVGVEANPGDPSKPFIRGQVPTQVHVRFDEETGEAIDALKLWIGRDRHMYATLYTPEYVRRYQSTTMLPAPGHNQVYSKIPDASRIHQYDWQLRQGMMTPSELDNPFGRVPFVPFFCHPDMEGGYTSELTPVMPIQKRINKTLFDRLLAQEFTAFPQRWATGIDIPINEETGEPVETLDAAIDRVWTATSPETSFGQFASGDISPYLSAEQSDIQALATQSRTPPHYLMGGMGQFPSGESVRATEYSLSRKVHAHQLVFGDAWCDVLRMAARAAGDDALAKDDALDVKWSDVEARSEGERVDALLKMATLGVPRRVLWEKWGATPTEIPQWDAEFDREQQRMADLGYTTTTGPTPVPPSAEEQAQLAERQAEQQAKLSDQNAAKQAQRTEAQVAANNQTNAGQRNKAGQPNTGGSGGTSNRPNSERAGANKPTKPSTSRSTAF